MTRLTLLALFITGTFTALARQVPRSADTIFFDKKYTRCERQWVMYKTKQDGKFSYGYIYIDAQAGFTFDLKGNFTIDSNGRFNPDTALSKTSVKYRIARDWGYVAIIPPTRYQELALPAEPEWIKYYYNYTDTLAHNLRWGWIYNDIDESEIALTYLTKAYAVKPHAQGLEFELAFAYNGLQRPDEAIQVLELAVQHEPRDVLFHRELGYAYLKKKDFTKSINYYLSGIDLCTDDKQQLEAKSEMAINLSRAYEGAGDTLKAAEWKTKAKQWAPAGSKISEFVKNL